MSQLRHPRAEIGADFESNHLLMNYWFSMSSQKEFNWLMDTVKKVESLREDCKLLYFSFS